MKSTLFQNIAASCINFIVVGGVSSPIAITNGYETWRPSVIGLWFVYNWIFRERCIGMIVMGTSFEKPVSVTYVTLHTLGFLTIFYHLFLSYDLLLANGLLQLISMRLTGGTIYSSLSGEYVYGRPDRG